MEKSDKPTEMRSEGPFYEMIFRSNEDFDSLGFKATYQFTEKEKAPALFKVKQGRAQRLTRKRIDIETGKGSWAQSEKKRI